MTKDSLVKSRKGEKGTNSINQRKVKLTRSPGFRNIPYSPNKILRINKNLNVSNEKKYKELKLQEKNSTKTLVIPDGVQLKPTKCTGGIIENKFCQQMYATPPPSSSQQQQKILEPLKIESILNSPRKRVASLSSSSRSIAMRREPSVVAQVSPKSSLVNPKKIKMTEEKNKKKLFDIKIELQTLKRENTSLRASLAELRLKHVTSKSEDLYTKINKTRRVSFSEQVNKIYPDSHIFEPITQASDVNTAQKTSEIREYQRSLEKQVKQANEMVRVCLEKVREAETKAQKVSKLEMEVIVLKRQLAQKRTRGRLNIRDSTLSDDCILRRDTDQSENVFLESPISNSLQRASMGFTTSEKISFILPPSSSDPAVNEMTLKRRSRFDSRGSSDSSKSDNDERNFTISTSCDTICSYFSVQSESYEKLYKQHSAAMTLVKELENKFSSQQSEMDILHTKIENVCSTTHHGTLQQNSSFHIEKLIRRLHKCKVSHRTLGKLLYYTLEKKQENLKDMDFFTLFCDVIKHSEIPGVKSVSFV